MFYLQNWKEKRFFNIFNVWMVKKIFFSDFSKISKWKKASRVGVLTTLNFIGACNPKVYLIFVDPKSKVSQKSDEN